ncbi:hypothetical protein Q1695_010137 [Nippostrongylus brasiliensis]|nr:hypothetical protein Q1695_010137 [Nippostrongylus brasiliensis]
METIVHFTVGSSGSSGSGYAGNVGGSDAQASCYMGLKIQFVDIETIAEKSRIERRKAKTTHRVNETERANRSSTGDRWQVTATRQWLISGIEEARRKHQRNI